MPTTGYSPPSPGESQTEKNPYYVVRRVRILSRASNIDTYNKGKPQSVVFHQLMDPPTRSGQTHAFSHY
ncbi:hypothetical protein QVD17_31779 [Tagetes erecta]|uniref:Uncharacterized protein n=1 Tax=Tagetes erecta TaxID=13708 RepID=A0AAD8K7P5_TARER|nr:hypothetical protein QVD17_31779 [Tagetes erecta]